MMKVDKVSVVIPARNAENTLDLCLKSVYASDFKSFEVIVVDDASTDNTPNLIGKYPCRGMRLDAKKGVSYARNRGSELAEGGIILFIDADIVIKTNTIGRIVETVEKRWNEVDAVMGILSKGSPTAGVFTRYKNLHMHYHLKNMPEHPDTIFTSITAIKKDVLKKVGGFNENYVDPGVEDIEVGQRLVENGYRVFLDKGLEVHHLKEYTLTSLLRNDFKRSISWMHLLIGRGYVGKALVRKRFAYLPILSAASILIAPLALLAIVTSLSYPQMIASLSLIGLFLVLNREFLLTLRSEGQIPLTVSVPILFCDSIIISAGALAGFLSMPFTSGREL